jgi:hypothetical protein
MRDLPPALLKQAAQAGRADSRHWVEERSREIQNVSDWIHLPTHWPVRLGGSHEDLLGFMFSEREIVAAHANFDGITQGGKANKFNRGSDEKAHFHETWAAFRGKFYFGDGCSCAQCDGGQRLKSGGHVKTLNR